MIQAQAWTSDAQADLKALSHLGAHVPGLDSPDVQV